MNTKVDCVERASCFFKGCLIALAFLSLILSGCSSVPKSYTQGMEQYRSGSYEDAANSFEQAAKAMPKDEKISLTLADAHYKAAEASASEAEATAKLDLRAVIELYQTASDHAEKSLAALRPVLSRENSGPSLMDKLKKFKDARYQTLREQQEQQNEASLTLKAQINEELQAANTKLTKVLGETARILALNRSAPGSAYDEYVEYFPYVPYLPEVRDAKLEIEQITIKQLELDGFARINAMKYAEADQVFQRLGTILGGENRARAGMHAIESHKAFTDRHYRTAFAELVTISSIYPDSPFLKEYYEKTQLLLIETQLAQVDGLIARSELASQETAKAQPEQVDALIARNELASLIEAFEKLATLSEATKGNAVFLEMVDRRSKMLRPMVAACLVRRAENLKRLDEMLFSSLILQNLQLARQFDPSQVKTLDEDAAKAFGATSRKGEMRVYVSYEGGKGDSLEWARRLESDLIAALEKSGIPGLSIADKSSLKEAAPNDLSVVDLAIRGSVDAVEFTETGRDTPRRRSSKYVSGTRQVNNPEYQENEQACRDAEATYNSLYTAMESLKRECDNLNGFIAQSVCRMGISYVSEDAKNTACNKWHATPRTLDENVISSYQYDLYTVKLNGLVRGKCSLTDNLNRSETQCAEINEKIKREGTIITNAQPTDTEGIRDAEKDVPDLVNEQEAAYKKIAEAVSAELLKNVAALRSERYCKLAESQKNNLKAMEAYNLCAFFHDSNQPERRAELDAKLNKYFVISPDQAQAFGLQGNDTNIAWPASRAEVADSNLNAVIMKHRE